MANLPYGDLVVLVVSGPAQGRNAQLDRPLLLGRDSSSRLQLDDDRISRHHAMIEIEGSQIRLRDLGSKNGTFVNGLEIKTSCVLEPGDRVRIGKTTIGLVTPDDGEISSSSARPDLDTNHDGMEEPAEYKPNSDILRVNRKTLRQATDLAAALSGILKQRKPIHNFMIALKKEFRADALCCFSHPDSKVVWLEGSVGIMPDELTNLLKGDVHVAQCRLINPVVETGPSNALHSPVMMLPLRLAPDVKWLIFLRRDDAHSFVEADASLAEMVTECLRLAPIGNLRQEINANQLPLNLGIVGSSDVLKKIREQLQSYAVTNATVLVRGESGTGKELCARAIAQLSPRRAGPYVEMNAACISPALLEAELFGHEKGSFTGAIDRRIGKLESAHLGTLFLDEVGELPIDLQAKLLRVLEGQPFYRIGGNTLIHCDVRFVCATNRDLEKMVKEGQFREDLYHRINILSLHMPALREHIDDVPELITHLLAKIQEGDAHPRHFRISPHGYRRLLSYHWPGNVRELRNALHRMMLLAKEDLLDDTFIPDEIGNSDSDTTNKLPRLQMLTEMMEREEITRTLLEARGQKSLAARLLGISRPTLDKKIKTYGLTTAADKSGDVEFR